LENASIEYYYWLFNYRLFNGFINIFFIIGLIIINGLFFIISLFGKLGFFPFLLALVSIISCCSYLFSLFDLINKFVYFGSFLVIFNLSFFFNNYFLLFLNLFIILFGIKFIPSIKIITLVSSLINFLSIILLIFVED